MGYHTHTRFYYSKLLSICLIIIAALAIFQALNCVGVGVGKFLIYLGVRNILDTIITWSGNMLVSGCVLSCITVMD
jgi:hypothetical protein